MDTWCAAWDHGQLDALDAVLAEDYVRYSAANEQPLSRQQYKDQIREVRAAFPDLTTTVDALLLDGDQAAMFWHSVGTFSAPLHDVPPTGTVVTTRGSNVLTFRDGKIVREEVTWDASELLADVGLPSLKSAFEPEDVAAVVDSPANPGTPPREMLKAFNKQFITGVTVVATKDETGAPRGLALNSYVSVSLDPPLVLVCVQKTSSTYPALFRASHVGISIMSSTQGDALSVFSSKDKDKFSQVAWHEGPQGSPLIDDSAASLEIEIKERFQALTHTVFIGRVQYAESTEDAPILYKAGKFYDGRGLQQL
ncbi:flavin reductase [Citricoccus sp.]|nr:flavin reductase [Citricoccus sp.]